jgi:uncharacterized protein
MLDYLQTIIRPLVERPDDVKITVLEGEKSFIAEMRCHGGDIGKLIGKNGKTITSIRTLVSSAAARKGRRAVVEIVE